jgi:hypothetical protein
MAGRFYIAILATGVSFSAAGLWMALNLGGCGKVDGDCARTPRWEHQCVASSTIWSEVPGHSPADAASADAGALDCPTAELLRYYLVRPYSVQLMGDMFESGPEPGQAQNLCCYTTTGFCY